MRRLLITLLLLTWPVAASAQVRLATISASDTLSFSGDYMTVAVGGMGTIKIQTLDSYSGTWEVRCSLDGGTTFDADSEVPVTLLSSTPSQADAVSDVVGVFDASLAAACTHIRIIATAGFAATDTTIYVSGASTGGGSGSTSGSTSEVTIDVDDIVSDASTELAAALNSDKLDVNIATVNGTAPSSEVSSGTLQNAVTANGNGSTLSVNGYTFAILTVNCSSCSGGTTVNFEGSEDGTNYVALELAQRVSAPATVGSTTTTSGLTYWRIPVAGLQVIRARVSAYSSGTITVTGRAVFGGATGYHASLGIDTAGNAALVDPCTSGTKVTAGFSIAADGEFIDGTASQKTYICSWWFVAAAAEQVSIVSEDDDGSCNKTSGVALVGTTTDSEGPSFAANGGVSNGNGASAILVSDTAGDDLCIYLNGTSRVAGTVTYVKR